MRDALRLSLRGGWYNWAQAMHRCLVLTFFGTLLCHWLATTPAAQRTPDPCGIDGVRRIIAVGDVHGGYDELVRILRAAAVIDARDRWTGGDTYLVQTGDVLDRGAESRRALDLLRRLEREAAKSRGRVVALVGNHEVMRVLGIVRDTNPAEIGAFRTARSGEIRDTVRQRWLASQRDAAAESGAPLDVAALTAKFDAETPLGLVEMLNAFAPQGDYGKWIRGNAAAARINGILFLHGGVSPRVAPLGCAGINAGVRTDLTSGLEQMRQAPLESLSMSEDGPLWYRGLAREDEETFAPELVKILETVGARAIVIGHTVSDTGRIRPRFGGRVVQIDTGMLSIIYKGGRPSALEIVGDRWTAIYEDGRTPLVESHPGAVPADASAGRRITEQRFRTEQLRKRDPVQVFSVSPLLCARPFPG
jgi:hypothetical protein